MRLFKFIILFICTSSYAQSSPKTENLEQPHTIVVEEQLKNSMQALEMKISILELKYEKLLLRHDTEVGVSKIKHATNEESKDFLDLSNEVSELKIKLVELQNFSSLIKVNGNHNDWTGVMLGAASLIFTGISIFIAILAIWGYRNIKNGAVESAIDNSYSVITSRIENGEFNDIIYKAVEKAIYRNILSSNDFPETMDDDDESM